MATPLTVSLPDDRLMPELGEIEGVQWITWDLATPAPRHEIDMVVLPYLDGPQLVRALEGVEVRLVQHQSIGYDGLREHLPNGLRLANATSVHEASTAELAVTLALAMQRGVPSMTRDAGESRWAPTFRYSLADRRVLLVGYGGVGKAVEQRIAPFEVELTRVASGEREEKNNAGETVQVFGVDQIHYHLRDAEIVIVTVPLNSSTRGMFDKQALAALPDNALLVNVARGGVVDTEALMAELRSERLRAALDVVDPEPLPEGHELWGLPGVLISPHIGGDTSAMIPRMAQLIKRQIAHLQAGKTPENLVIVP